MRTPEQIARFNASIEEMECKICDRFRYVEGKPCACLRRIAVHKRAFAGCVPQEFWDLTFGDMLYNLDVLRGPIATYCGLTEDGAVDPTPEWGLNYAMRNGKSLYLFGANGTGKTTYGNFVLMEFLRRRRYSVYYTTMMSIHTARTNSFSARQRDAELEMLLKNVDVLFLDELMKERVGLTDTVVRVLLEDVLKERYQNRRPTIVASNAEFAQIALPTEQGGYGTSIASMINGGRYQIVTFDPGDNREHVL